MRKLQFTLVLFIVSIALSNLSAQSLVKKANKQFDLRAYDLAIENYLKVVNEDPANNEVKLKLAESYRLTNQFIEAIAWYEKASAENSVYSEDMVINYAHTLKNVGLYDKAQKMYQKFSLVDQEISSHYGLSCDFAKEALSRETDYRISLMKFSTRESDFGVTFYNDLMVFCSFNENEANNTNTDGGNLLYIENEDASGVELLRAPMRELHGIGPLSYSPDNKMVAYTKNNFINGYKQVYEDEESMSIYYAIVDENGDFADDKAFPFNGTDYSTAFPHLAYNGSALYFCSNKLGGFGGFDIYVSYLKNGEWTRPENLGPSVNTKGNEITPFLDGGDLYFASDYHLGIGGYDIFKSAVKNGEWSFAENLGKGVNSPADDYYFAMNRMSGEMFFSSNRMGGRGNDDIYVASKKEIIDLAQVQLLEADDEINMPQAVVLDTPKPGMVKEGSSNVITVSDTAPSSREVAKKVTDKTEVTVVSELNKSMSFKSMANMSLYGARKVSFGEVINTNANVYFIQLASLKFSRGSVDAFSSLLQYGNLYKFYKTSATKIKLGYYMDRFAADDVLRKVKSMGYRDAFITNEPMNDADMELVLSSNNGSVGSVSNSVSTNSTNYNTSSRAGSNYKVRLAAYEDPLWFKVDEVKDLGTIEQWSKGAWTIFILSGYNTLEEAQSAKRKALNRGYSDAEIVIDNNGILERLSRN